MASPRSLLGFPDPVDEVSARLVAAGVVLLCLLVLATGAAWLLAAIAAGFLARVLCGPRVSPLALLVTRAVRPRLPVTPRPVPGPPKRFAQGIGLLVSATAALLALGAGATGASLALAGVLALAALAESALGFCLGCRLFALLMRLGVIPERVCVACADLGRSRPTDARAA